MIQRYAEGLNYHIDLDDARAICKVWSRPDLDSTRGAAQAVEKIAHFRRLARGDAQSMLFDLSQAPPVAGPKTQQALSEMLDAWQNAKKPIAIVMGSQPIQHLQLRRLIATAAPDTGAAFTSLEQAQTWLDAERERRQR